jgi:hypothetical protein
MSEKEIIREYILSKLLENINDGSLLCTLLSPQLTFNSGDNTK